jgi:enoyl-CoA hydratase
MKPVDVQRHGTAAIIRLNAPERRNILSPGMSSALSRAILDANEDATINVIVITGEPPCFCAGADLADLEAAANGDMTAVNLVYRAFMDVAESRLPTIAAVNGSAIGAGLNLALACDMRVAGASASFESRFLKIGIHPGGGHGWMLLRTVGWGEASRMLLLNHVVGAAEAERIGLVQQTVPDDKLMAIALDLAVSADALPRETIIHSKETLRRATESDHPTALLRETAQQAASLGAPPFRQLVERTKQRLARQ